MNAKWRSKAKAPSETDLFGEPVRLTTPSRKAVPRPDGHGWCIAVREAASTAYLYIGIYGSRAEAGQAIRDGVGAVPREAREEMRLEVRFTARRGLR